MRILLLLTSLLLPVAAFAQAPAPSAASRLRSPAEQTCEENFEGRPQKWILHCEARRKCDQVKDSLRHKCYGLAAESSDVILSNEIGYLEELIAGLEATTSSITTVLERVATATTSQAEQIAVIGERVEANEKTTAAHAEKLKSTFKFTKGAGGAFHATGLQSSFYPVLDVFVSFGSGDDEGYVFALELGGIIGWNRAIMGGGYVGPAFSFGKGSVSGTIFIHGTLNGYDRRLSLGGVGGYSAGGQLGGRVLFSDSGFRPMLFGSFGVAAAWDVAYPGTVETDFNGTVGFGIAH